LRRRARGATLAAKGGAMDDGILTALGGVGLFLFGMSVLTEALRTMAGTRLRRVLARFTATPLRGALTGAAVTAAVQSSSAVTVMTLGFVGAGLMTFPQSLGVLYGANVGTTATGWIVTLVGIKLDMAQLALPLLFGAALAAALGPPQARRVGQAAAGLALLFLGIGFMQAGMAGIEGRLTPDVLPGDTLAGRLQLVLIGTALAALLQSSSAGMAIGLVLLGAGAISFAQAAAIVVGLNIGTCFTGLIAVLGGTRAAQQAAVANVLFNVISAVAVLPLFGVVTRAAAAIDAQTALVVFHTALNAVGVALFLPFNAPFARLVTWLVPDRDRRLSAPLDRALLADPDAALDAAQAVAGAIANEALSTVAAALAEPPEQRPLATLAARLAPEIAVLEDYLARIAVPHDRARTLGRYTALLHMIDHTARLVDRADHAAPLDGQTNDPLRRRAACALSAAASRAVAGEDRARVAARLARLAPLIARRAARHRRATLLAEHVGLVSVGEMFRRTDAMRWIAHVAAHAERIAHYRLAAAEREGR
jgi:phosphate:Na+ symporter